MPSESLRQEDCRANVFQHHPGLGDARRRAAAKANELLSSSDKEWERIRPLMRVKDDATFQALKRRYREGILKRSVAENQADAEVLYQFGMALSASGDAGMANQVWAAALDAFEAFAETGDIFDPATAKRLREKPALGGTRKAR